MNDADMPVYLVLNMTLVLGKSRNEESSGPTYCNFKEKKNTNGKFRDLILDCGCVYMRYQGIFFKINPLSYITLHMQYCSG